MASSRHDRSRATGLVRALVVASATLAILLVCFSIYQYSQLDPEAAARLRATASSLPVEPGEGPNGRRYDNTPGVDIGDRGKIGAGRKMDITLYPREGRRAQIEVSVDDWTPVAGAGNEFLLTGPDVRMRTKDGHAVHVTAQEGTLEAQRKGHGGLDPQRGKLTGDVVIRYDRLSETDRANLPPERRDRIDPADLVQIETDEIEFDVEYSKVIVPGRLRFLARDVDWETGDVEIRFNEAESRVERMRVGRGGRLVLRDAGQGPGLGLPSMDAGGERRLTVAEWLRASIQSRLNAPAPSDEPPTATPATPPVTYTEDGIPIFRGDADGEHDTEGGQETNAKPPIRYYARFEGDIRAEQRTGDATQVRLDADLLELVRELVTEDRARVQPAGSPATTSGTETTEAFSEDGAPPTGAEQFVLTWTERLLVEVCRPEHEPCAEDVRAKLIAVGSPARISGPEGNATCHRLTFNPDGSEFRLVGTDTAPVIVRYGDQGTLTGLVVESRRRGDELDLHATGPGTLVQVAGGALSGSLTPDNTSGTPPTIQFTDRLDAAGRFEMNTRIDLTGHVASRERRVLDKATFGGAVRMSQNQMGLSADAVTLTFGARPGAGEHSQTVERIEAQGHVLLTEKDDRMTCREIDIALADDPDGRTVPRTATASGDVVARQSDRTIQARDKLIVDFETIERPAPRFDLAQARAAAERQGLDVTLIDWDARRREHEAASRRQVAVGRLQAFGEVTVHDAAQSLDVSAEHLDCAMVDGRDIDTAIVEGLDDRPASVGLDTFTVTGQRISLNVPDEYAEVPGPGRLAFQTLKDLDGRRLDTPIPVAITWSDWMKYQGRENRSVFSGRVHATSQTATTFDCQQLEVEFDDVAASPKETAPAQNWWIFQDLVDRATDGSRQPSSASVKERFSKEPAYILATGNAVALTSAFDDVTGGLKSRARIAGPKLSVNLRPDVSRMMIEGTGNLLIEDNLPDRTADAASRRRTDGGLFGVDDNAGPSTTLIEWRDMMWYDFSIDQTRFEGDVSLKYFSGAELQRIGKQPPEGSADAHRGRATFMTCDVLTVDFLNGAGRSRPPDDRRMGRISADQLAQFQAAGSVSLQDVAEGLSLTADRVIYWKDRDVLAVYGTPQRKAFIVTQKPGQLPNQVSVERLFYDLSTGQVEISSPTIRAR